MAVCSILAVTGVLLDNVKLETWDEAVSLSRDHRFSGTAAVLLGNFRGLAADLMWIKAYREWSQRDVNAMRTTLGQAVMLNPSATDFWLNGARMLAYDVTAWRLGDLETQDFGSLNRIKHEQLGEALGFLELGRRSQPEAWELDVEAAIIRMNLTEDWAGALAILESLEHKEGVPYYIGRIRAEILLKLDRKPEALTWLRKFESTLPDDDPAARKEVVWSRIAELEHRK